MAIDMRPRLVVHHVLGDFVIDPFADGRPDLSQYGITGYDVIFGPPAEGTIQPVTATIGSALMLGGLAALLVWGATKK